LAAPSSAKIWASKSEKSYEFHLQMATVCEKPTKVGTQNTISFMNSKIFNFAAILAIGLSLSIGVFAQKAKPAPKKTAVEAKATPTPDPNLPKVTQIDTVAMQNLFKREGENQKPLLVNFWATWCAPCIEEFPDLVKIDNDYKGKIDFITITLDDISEINTGVPKFLQRMKAEMPTYLLKTDDEGAAISTVYQDWAGGLPFTIFFDGKGAVIYNRQGKVVDAVLRKELDKVVLAK
jgi:thiol-disulfide isomerase/thioredoxin